MKKTLTKRDLVKYLHEELGFSARSLARVVDLLFEEIKRALERGEEVKIVRFGIFEPYQRPTRKGVSPQDGSPILIQGKKTAVFRPSPTLKEFINR
ncbi:MAG TPA: integration host factor subunit alpha [Thermodesulfatator atlanticus]|uniref:Integration host factor subunit alpha n=1 Tax=Thermodesulfatator atlanticus TaxID=501497 RepID=A0A7V5P085_9BACT|nr:integration host factor subunit alpha [Thermodesulfatator atlanticus]